METIKLYQSFAICIFALILLSNASADLSKDKRFPLFDYLTTKAHEYTTDELIEYGTFYNDLLTEAKASLKSQQIYSVEFEEFEETINKFIQTVENLKADKQNCDLLQEAKKLAEDITEPSLMWTDLYDYQEHNHKLDLKKFQLRKSKLNEISPNLEAIIRTFLASLNAEEKDNFKDLVMECELFLLAKNNENKQINLLTIAKYYNTNDFNTSELESLDCKWNLRDYEMAFYGMKTYAMQSVP